MRVPLQITYRDVESSPALEERIREKASWLEHVCGDVTSCRVVVEAPHRRHQHGTRYHVRIDLSVPGTELQVSRDADDPLHEDVYVAVRDAFDDARRQLDAWARRRRDAAAAADRTRTA